MSGRPFILSSSRARAFGPLSGHRTPGINIPCLLEKLLCFQGISGNTPSRIRTGDLLRERNGLTRGRNCEKRLSIAVIGATSGFHGSGRVAANCAAMLSVSGLGCPINWRAV